ncbi:MAG: GntR family transcriptional regulator, partial [Micromonosporaceae bacterium]
MYEIAPVRPSEPLGDEIARRLRFLVVTGRLAPGTHLVEDRLAKDFDVSRGPIRDALRLLTAEGLLESRRRGTYVTGFTADDIQELYSLREAMESLALTLAMGRSEAASWAALDEPVRAMRQAADAADTEAFAAADLDFHSRFYHLSGHRRLISVWEHYRP